MGGKSKILVRVLGSPAHNPTRRFCEYPYAPSSLPPGFCQSSSPSLYRGSTVYFIPQISPDRSPSDKKGSRTNEALLDSKTKIPKCPEIESRINESSRNPACQVPRPCWVASIPASSFFTPAAACESFENKSTFTFNVRGGEWSFKHHGSRKIFAEFHSSRNLVFLAVMCVSQSQFFPSQERLEVVICLYLYISLMTS